MVDHEDLNTQPFTSLSVPYGKSARGAGNTAVPRTPEEIHS